MKPKTVLTCVLLLVFVGVALVIYHSDSTKGTAELVSKCIQIEEGALSNLSGSLVFESRKDDEPSFVLDLGTGEKRELANLTVSSIVGPSKAGLMTYYNHVLETWMLVDLQSGVESVRDEFALVTPILWMDDGRLLVGNDRLQVLDLESGGMENVISDSVFSQIDENMNWSSALNWNGFSPYRIVPGRDLNYLAYVANGEPGVLLIVWDQGREQEIARLHWADISSTPQWAPDGKSFVSSAPPFVFYMGHVFTNVVDDLPHVGGFELMQVGMDGSVRRLTTFTSRVNAVENRYTWSPDGKYLAFGLEFMSDDGRMLRAAILDVESGEVTAFCLPPHAGNMVGLPVWSPDGRKLALTLMGEDHLSQAYIIDPESGNAKRVEINVQIVGWWGD